MHHRHSYNDQPVFSTYLIIIIIMAAEVAAAGAEGEWNLKGMLSQLVRTMGMMMVINHLVKTIMGGMQAQGPQHGDTSRNPVAR